MYGLYCSVSEINGVLVENPKNILSRGELRGFPLDNLTVVWFKNLFCDNIVHLFTYNTTT